ncbi:hypothetical protein [Rhodococcus sp. IEGM 1374]|uniref:hypothetical protein n=1 Tax=Rhodococcus sp. IEGM 1374 TaxID=3082221 RepID=UPI00295312C0|nr:hypothetical protein [Rhodococcus sp. IEGM 1374]MDV7991213.1 hypothetical protein [Rhodococcus sp. IEGM 1374]
MTSSPGDCSDLWLHLAEQVQFLKNSAEKYDEGYSPESKRLATTIRVLVHDGTGVSLLKQLDVRSKMTFMALGGGVDRDNLLPTSSLLINEMEVGEGFMRFRYLPICVSQEEVDQAKFLSFDDWWTALSVVKDQAGREFSRKQLVLALANRDGGAHVASLSPKELALAVGGSMGITLEAVKDDGSVEVSEPVAMNPLFASVRAIAFELVNTIEFQLSAPTETGA